MVQDRSIGSKTKQIADSYHYQRQIKEQNRGRIISELNQGPKRFTDLLSITGFSPMGLTKMLKELTKEGKIRKEIHKGKEAYVLTDRGQQYYSKDVWHLLAELTEMKERGASYVHNEVGLGLALDNVVLNNIDDSKKIINNRTDGSSNNSKEAAKEQAKKGAFSSLPFLFGSDDNEQELQEFIVRKVIEYVKEKKVVLSESIDSKAILGISIDYHKLTAFLAKVQLFTKIVAQGKYRNVFDSAELGLNSEGISSSKSKVMLLERYLYHASLFGDAEYEKKLDGFFASLADGLIINRLFPNIEHHILKKVIADIKRGIYPLRDAEIKDKLAYREGQKGYPLLEYMYAARFVKSKDKDFRRKLDDLMAKQLDRQQKWELFEYRRVMEHSQIERLVAAKLD
jgi:DNA-binding HxlR family transcriptional regulator